MRGLLVGIVVWSLGWTCHAQEKAYQEVDSATYALFIAEDWIGLKAYGEQHPQDFYYYNIRMGVANCLLGAYFEAELYLLKALKQNTNDYVKMYLYWTYLGLGDDTQAERIYHEMGQATQEVLQYEKKPIHFASVDMGVKVPTYNALGNMNFLALTLGHGLLPNLRMKHQFSSYGQRQGERSLQHVQYNVAMSYNWKWATATLGGTWAQSTFNNADLMEGMRFAESSKALGGMLHASLTKRINRLRLNADLMYIFQSTQYQYSLSSTPGEDSLWRQEGDSLIGESVFMPSLTGAYTPRLWSSRLTFGADIFTIFSDGDVHVTAKPFLLCALTPQWDIWMDYTPKGKYLFADKTNGIFYNASFLSTDRLSTTLQYKLNQNLMLRGTYTFERVEDDLEDLNYNLNSLFLGLQYKF